MHLVSRSGSASQRFQLLLHLYCQNFLLQFLYSLSHCFRLLVGSVFFLLKLTRRAVTSLVSERVEYFFRPIQCSLRELRLRGVFTWQRGEFQAGASSLRFPLMALYLFTWYHHKMSYRCESHRREFTPVRNFATVSCKRKTTTRSAVRLERVAHE